MKIYSAGYQELAWFDAKRNRFLLSAFWYPTTEAEEPITYLGHFIGSARLNATLISMRRPLVILSHGSRGHRFNQFYLAEFLARNGYAVIAIEHTGDTTFSSVLSNSSDNHIHRIYDVLFVYQQMMQHAVIGKLIYDQSVIHMGHSFGGFTSYVLTGGLSTVLSDEVIQAVKSTLKDRLTCGVMLAPALSETMITPQPKLTTPMLLMTAGQDELLGESPKQYINCYETIKSLSYPNTGHYVFLMPCPEAVAMCFPKVAYDPGIARESIHPKINAAIGAFLANQLPATH